MIAGSVQSSQSTVFSCPTPPSQSTPTGALVAAGQRGRGHRQILSSKSNRNSSSQPQLQSDNNCHKNGISRLSEENVNQVGTFIWHLASNKIVRDNHLLVDYPETTPFNYRPAQLTTHCKWIESGGCGREFITTVGVDSAVRSYDYSN